jgi:hypothetical protein
MHNGIELRIEIDGRPIMISDSAMLHGLLRFSVGHNSRDLLDAVNTHGQKVSVIVKAVTVHDDAELSEHADECEAAEPAHLGIAPEPVRPRSIAFDPEELAVLREEIRGVFADLAEPNDERPYRSNEAHWWDRAELLNWQYRQSGSEMYGLMLVHLPCGTPEYRIESLTESVSRAAGHRCPRDQPPAYDGAPAGVVEFLVDRERRG